MRVVDPPDFPEFPPVLAMKTGGYGGATTGIRTLDLSLTKDGSHNG